MKINPISTYTALSTYKTQKTQQAASSFQSAMDQVSLSDEVVSFSSTINKIKEQMDVRTPEELAHIENITQLIHSGNYFVPSQQIAAKMLDDIVG